MDGKCRCEIGTVKQWFKGVAHPFIGAQVCDAYACKKAAGVKVEKTGDGRKRARPAAESSTADNSRDDHDSDVSDFPKLLHVNEIIGYDLSGYQHLEGVAARQSFTSARYQPRVHVRGWFKDAPDDPGVTDARVLPQAEVLAASGGEAAALAFARVMCEQLCVPSGKSAQQAYDGARVRAAATVAPAAAADDAQVMPPPPPRPSA